MSESTFPVLWPHRSDEIKRMHGSGCPRFVPLSLVLDHAAQAHRNHGQTVARLAQRGGLSPAELVKVLEDRSWNSGEPWNDADAVPRLLVLLGAAAEAVMTEPKLTMWRDGAALIEHENRSISIAAAGGVCLMVDGRGVGIHRCLVPWRHFHWLLYGNGLDPAEDHAHD